MPLVYRKLAVSSVEYMKHFIFGRTVRVRVIFRELSSFKGSLARFLQLRSQSITNKYTSWCDACLTLFQERKLK